MNKVVGAALGALAGYALVRAVTPKYSFKGRRVLITGGSKGLGLVLARTLIQEGAQVALLARSTEELEHAAIDLKNRYGVDVLTLSCDVRDEADVVAAVKQVSTVFGGLDVLVNNAGVIQAGPFENLDNADFEDALATHLWGPLYAIQASLPHLQASGGRILNIASVGGLVGVPHLASYSASKFALVGLSDALRAELASKGIKVTTVCPWLMRTGSHYNVQLKGQHAKEFTLFALADALPGSSMSAETAARRCVEALRSGKARVAIGSQAKAAHLVDTLFPDLAKAGLELTNRVLPSAAASNQVKTGWEVKNNAPLVPSILTRLADNAGVRNNETPRSDPI